MPAPVDSNWAKLFPLNVCPCSRRWSQCSVASRPKVKMLLFDGPSVTPAPGLTQLQDQRAATRLYHGLAEDRTGETAGQRRQRRKMPRVPLGRRRACLRTRNRPSSARCVATPSTGRVVQQPIEHRQPERVRHAHVPLCRHARSPRRPLSPITSDKGARAGRCRDCPHVSCSPNSVRRPSPVHRDVCRRRSRPSARAYRRGSSGDTRVPALEAVVPEPQVGTERAMLLDGLIDVPGRPEAIGSAPNGDPRLFLPASSE